MNRENKITISEILASFYYIWALLPIFCAEYAGYNIRMTMYSLLISSIILTIIHNKFVIRNKTGILVVTILMISYLVMDFFEYKNAHQYVNVVLAFWSTYILNFLMNDNQKKRFTKFIIILIAITTITSSIGVIFNNNASRIISHAISDNDQQIEMSRKNIAGIYLFQGLVILMPAVDSILNKKKIKIILMIMLLITLLNASYSIALIIAIIASIINCIYYNVFKKRKMIGIFLSMLLIFIGVFVSFYGQNILSNISSIIGNEKISERINEINTLIYGNSLTGDANERFRLYSISFETFLNNTLFGVGPYYSFIKFQDGIGYHSQILDDLARFGLIGLAYYICFFKIYYNNLKESWASIGNIFVPKIIIVLYLLFLLLNIGFRSDFESVIVFIIIPNIPLLVEKNNKERKKKFFKKRDESKY